jgi:hypothetical protein
VELKEFLTKGVVLPYDRRTTYVKNSFNSTSALYSTAPSQIPSLIAMGRALGFVLDPKFGVISGGTRDKGGNTEAGGSYP